MKAMWVLYPKMVSNQNKITNLSNRLALMKDLSNNKFEKSIIILVSLNNILKIQNSYGYEISNDIIIQFVNFLKKYNQTQIDKIYANSYNIFSLKYIYTSDETLKSFIQQLIKDIEQESFEIKSAELEFSLEITLGVSDPHNINNSLEELNEAENALDYALDQHIHLNIYNTSSKNTIEKNKQNINIAKQIKQAIELDRIEAHYQPIFNNLTGKIEKYEALIRLRQHDNSLIFPDLFLPIAKQINKYNTLTYMIIDKSFQFFLNQPYEFSININILDINNPQFETFLFERLSHYHIANKVVLEIVEQEGVKNYEQFANFIIKAKDAGCKIAKDDFGSGYSNFEYILSLSEYIDYIKLDGSLVKEIVNNSKSQILLGSLKFLCDNLGIKTIAEYVENEEIHKYINSIGIDYSQGYYIGKPSPKIQS